jgi:subtilisin family serine protease
VAVTPGPRGSDEPLGDRQWDLAMLGTAEAQRRVTGAGVDVGIIDTGIDASHPDIAPNFDAARSRNFTVDIPAIDGPCEVPSCVDPANVDGKGHGTHVAGTIAAARNGFGISGVAPDARLVNLRAGQDSGYFFLYETLNALTAAGDDHLDVVNMSFYTDPWLYNCDSADDYVEGAPSAADLAQQRLTRRLVLSAVRYARDRGVTLVAAAGNEHADLAAPHRFDPFSPGYPPGAAKGRLVTKDCLDLPNEAPGVISVGSVGPSGTKADYSNYGFGSIDVTAPGGWLRDGKGTAGYQRPTNLILSSYPLDAAVEEGLADDRGEPTDAFSIRQCNALGACGFYTYLQGTSMASPHVAGVAALIVQRYGQGSALGGYSLAPDQVAAILQRTARDRACPAGGVVTYGAAGRPTSWNARCQGDAAYNGIYGNGIVDAAAAVR